MSYHGLDWSSFKWSQIGLVCVIQAQYHDYSSRKVVLQIFSDMTQLVPNAVMCTNAAAVHTVYVTSANSEL